MENYEEKKESSEDLEEYAKKLTKGAALDKHNLIWMCKKGAEWQKQQMMKDAVDAIVHKGLYSKYIKEQDSDALSKALEGYNPCDKVKIIIIKEEEK